MKSRAELFDQKNIVSKEDEIAEEYIRDTFISKMKDFLFFGSCTASYTQYGKNPFATVGHYASIDHYASCEEAEKHMKIRSADQPPTDDKVDIRIFKPGRFSDNWMQGNLFRGRDLSYSEAALILEEAQERYQNRQYRKPK